MNVEDIASKISVIFGIQHDWKDKISGFMFHQVMQRGGGITNHHLIAYSLSNISAKKLRKSVNVRWSYSVLHQCFFWDTVYVQVQSQQFYTQTQHSLLPLLPYFFCIIPIPSNKRFLDPCVLSPNSILIRLVQPFFHSSCTYKMCMKGLHLHTACGPSIKSLSSAQFHREVQLIR